MHRINVYLTLQVVKYFILIMFVFLSIAWLLQITRLFTVTNSLHIDVLDIDDEFLTMANKSGLYNLKGHRTVGGMRASVYNSMPIEGVERLISFMRKFESKQ